MIFFVIPLHVIDFTSINKGFLIDIFETPCVLVANVVKYFGMSFRKEN